MYNGPPPNYVELELQIVPFLAATFYKLFGIHEIFGRIISIAFGLGTVLVLAYFGRWLFASAIAGLTAAFFYSVFPGSVYYGRTFMPDCAMVFFLTVALYVSARYLREDAMMSRPGLIAPTLLLTFAYLAKPVAAMAIVPLLGLIWERRRAGGALRVLPLATLVLVPFIVLALYDERVAAYAQWHWASGIMRLHVLPALRAALSSGEGFGLKLASFRVAIGMLRETMLGSLSFALSLAAFVALPWTASRSKALLWGWLIAGVLYIFVVVTVERVDYYLLPLLPLCALTLGGATARSLAAIETLDAAPPARYALIGTVALVAIAAALPSRTAVASYYRYNQQAYRDAVALDRALPAGALVVLGHYGPDVQYYLDRFGWEEDPLLWTPFDEESAIRKGARYFIAIEENRLYRNIDLCAWLQRFPIAPSEATWSVYDTDPARVRPGADIFWRRFRAAERMGAGRAFLDRRNLCVVPAQPPKVDKSARKASGPTAMLPRKG